MKDIDKLLNEIKDEKDESQKKDKIKKLLTETDFILTKTALYPFEDEASKKESNYLKKFLEYKEPKAYNGMDCDVNLYSMVMYGLLEYGNDFDLRDIRVQEKKSEKYEIFKEDNYYRGDTLTSALYFIKLYIKYLWRILDNGEKGIIDSVECIEMDDSIDIESKLKIKEKLFENGKLKDIYNSFYELFTNINHQTGMISNSIYTLDSKISWEKYIINHSEIVWGVLDEPVKAFLKVYQEFGNYMCIPGGTDFNRARSGGGKFDTVDTLLSNLYGYCQYGGDNYLYLLFGKNKPEVVEETKKWLECKYKNDWNLFVNKNCLKSFVDKNNKPISMITGKVISDDELQSGLYFVKLNGYTDYLIFFEQLSKRIVWRTIDIYKKVRE